MATANQYVEYIVPIFWENRKAGVGTVVQKEDDTYTVLTCNHVVADGKDIREKLFIRNDNEMMAISIGDITLGEGIDLATIKIKNLKDKKVALLQKKLYDDSLVIFTFKDSGGEGLIPDDIDVKIICETTLDYGRVYQAFELEVNEPLDAGYSGSPLFDGYTHSMVGVVNIKDGRDGGYAVDIQHCRELIDDIKVVDVEDTMHKEKEEISRVFFDHQEGDFYKISINQTELFDGESINIEEDKVKLIGAINNYCCYHTCGEERELEIEVVELILPFHLLDKDIALWKDKDSENLVDNVEVLLRSYDRLEQGNLKKIKNKKLWKKSMDSDNNFKALSVNVSGSKFTKNKNFISAYLEAPSEISTPFEKIVKQSNIILWINRCSDVEEYQKVLEKLLKNRLKELPFEFRTQLTQLTDDSCAYHANLMWDDPNTLPKAYYE